MQIGYDESSWESGEVTDACSARFWVELSADESRAAAYLGYDQREWDDEAQYAPLLRALQCDSTDGDEMPYEVTRSELPVQPSGRCSAYSSPRSTPSARSERRASRADALVVAQQTPR